MQINRNNYEIYFLDYWENNLDDRDRIALVNFLESNPDLHNEFLDFKESSTITLSPENNIVFDAKDKLKKIEIVPLGAINADNIEDYFIAHLEGDLSDNEEAEFRVFMTMNPALNHDLALYKKTFLVADSGIRFKNKEQIKRSRTVLFPANIFYFSTAIAALLLLAFLIYNPFSHLTKSGNKDFAILKTQAPDKAEIKIHDRAKPLFLNEELAKARTVDQNIGDNKKTEIGVTETSKPSHPIVAQSNIEINSAEPFHRDLINVEQINFDEKAPVISTKAIAKAQIPEREEISLVFDDMILRDVLREENAEEQGKGALGRVLANIANQIFGLEEKVEDSPSLLAGMVQNGKERFMEIAEDSPLYETTREDGSKGKYFAINENFSIRLSKGDKPHKNSE